MENIINTRDQGVKGLETENASASGAKQGGLGDSTKEESVNEIDYDEEESKTIDMEKGDKLPNIDLEEFKKEQKEFKKKYKTLLTTFSDKNTVLHDGEDVKEASDVDMSNKMEKRNKEKLNDLMNFSYLQETRCL